MTVLNPDAMIAILTSRSFGSIWYWLAVVGLWSVAGRAILGVPLDVLHRARSAIRAGRVDGGTTYDSAPTRGDADGHDGNGHGGGHAAALLLLDWLSLTLPRWRIGPRGMAGVAGLICFALTFLAIMGWGYLAQMAQAAFLLLLPFAVLFWMRLSLSRGLTAVMDLAQTGAITAPDAAVIVEKRMTRHRRLTSVLSVVSVAVTALYGATWMALHPNGL